MRHPLQLSLIILAGLALALPAAQAATVTVINGDGAGEGFHDPGTPSPAMGCPDGMTLGQCRFHAAQAAAQVWADLLESDVEIRVLANFDPISCGVLGQSWSLSPSRDFSGAPLANTWYHRALADALSGVDRNPGVQDIQVAYNSSYDNGACAGGPWYYGVDANPGLVNALLFYPVILHEMAHGLGFATFMNKSTGAYYGGYPDAYLHNIYDTTTGLRWTQMNNAQRAASALNNLQVVWDGPETKAAADTFLRASTTRLLITTGPAAGSYDAIAAVFGGHWPAVDAMAGVLEVVSDGTANPSEGCQPLVGFTPGRIAFVDRGSCQFGLKALNAQNAGAAGVVVANNQGGTLLQGMAGGDDGDQVTIPVIGISQNSGIAIRTSLPQSCDADVLAVHGMHANGFPLLYTPTTLEQGSSVSHFDVTAFPDALMEPALNDEVWDDLDMTPGVLRDQGWPMVGADLLFADGFESGNTGAWSTSVP